MHLSNIGIKTSISSPPQENFYQQPKFRNQKKFIRDHENKWRNLFKNQISPEKISKYFQEQTKDMSFSKILAFYETAKTASYAFPSYKDKIPSTIVESAFQKELKQKSLTTIFHQYDIEKLHSYKLISDTLFDTYKTFNFELNYKNKATNNIETDFVKNCLEAAKKFESELNEIKPTDQNSMILIKLKKIPKFLEKIQHLNWESSLQISLPIPESKTQLTPIEELTKKFLNEISNLTKERKNQILKEQLQFDAQCTKLNELSF